MSPEGVWITPPALPPGPRKLAIKDLFDTAGVRATYGSLVFADHVPDATAPAVERLVEAGWVLDGKANLHEFAFGITSQNPHYGTVPNPAFPGRTAGGSSGGSAAAIALGEAEIGLGTDTGGSIRIPAACCAVSGFKPTHGVVPLEGCFPLAPSFDHAGPLARDVAGCAEAMCDLAEIEPGGPEHLSEVRAGLIWTEHADRPVAEVVEQAARRAGVGGRPDLDLPDDVQTVFRAEVAEVHRELFAAHRDLYGPNAVEKIGSSMEITSDEARASATRRDEFDAALEGAFGGLDVLVAPTLPIVPPRADVDEIDVREAMTLLTFPFDATGSPALAIPCGLTPEGLPVSLQVVGRRGDDALVLRVGALVEAALRHTAGPPTSSD